MPEPLICERCGAALALPPALEVVLVACAYCGQQSMLPAHIVDERRRQLVARHHAELRARDAMLQQEQQARDAAQRRKDRRIGLLVTLAGSALAVFALGVAFVFQLVTGGWSSSTPSRGAGNGSVQVEAALTRLRGEKCTHLVQAARTLSGSTDLQLEMRAGGNCVHLIGAGPGSAAPQIVLTAPDGQKPSSTATGGLAELRHCPTIQGTHTARFAGSAVEPFTIAAIDCPPEREKFKEDPKKNGRELVTAKLKRLTAAGCRNVALTPATLHGTQSFTLPMQRGGLCANVVAASGVEGNLIELALDSPLGETVARSANSTETVLEHCPKTGGQHSLSVKPALTHYYTIAAVDCPRGRGAGARR